MKAATPYLFGRFMRACLNPKESGQCAAARVWCQADKPLHGEENSWPDAGAPAMPLPARLPASAGRKGVNAMNNLVFNTTASEPHHHIRAGAGQ